MMVAMRKPVFDADGWCLEDGEKLQAQYPSTFKIPQEDVRNILQPGDFAKLVFSIAVEGEDGPSVERMWVIVRERITGGYLGILDNEPDCVEKNEEFWRGIELPFEPRHIIDVDHGNAESVAVAKQPVARPWQ